MKKWYEMIVKTIKKIKKYNDDETKLLSWLFYYLNNLDIDEEEFKIWISAKWLWKLLKPLTKNLTKQTFEKWWNSVSNIARLKENKDFEITKKVIIKKVDKKDTLTYSQKWDRSKKQNLDELSQ